MTAETDAIQPIIVTGATGEAIRASVATEKAKAATGKVTTGSRETRTEATAATTYQI